MAGTGLVAGEVVVDALPYFDQGYEAPGVREAVSAGCVRRVRPRHAALSRRDPGLLPLLVLRLRPWWRRRRAGTGRPRTT